jgi:hypothetical protein
MSGKTKVKIRMGATARESTVEVGGVDVSALCQSVSIGVDVTKDSLTRVSLVMVPLDLDLEVDGDVLVAAREMTEEEVGK